MPSPLGSPTPGSPASAVDPTGRRRLPGDALVRVGAAVFLLGLVAVLATIAPLLLGTARLPRIAYFLCLLAPIGLGLSLAGLLAQARAGRR